MNSTKSTQSEKKQSNKLKVSVTLENGVLNWSIKGSGKNQSYSRVNVRKQGFKKQ